MIIIPRRILIFSLIISGVFLALHLLASKFFWYFSIFWFDMLMHFIGGFVVGTAYLLGNRFLGRSQVRKKHLLIFVLIISLLWEAYEYIVQYIFHIDGIATLADSISDLGFDMLGALLLIFVLYLNSRGRYNIDKS